MANVLLSVMHNLLAVGTRGANHQAAEGTILIRLLTGKLGHGHSSIPRHLAGAACLSIGKSNHATAQNLIDSIVADKPSTPFHFVVARLLEKLQEENEILAFRDDATIPQIAWAARNVLELWVLARFVCTSQTNVDRFQNDIAIISPSTSRLDSAWQ